MLSVHMVFLTIFSFHCVKGQNSVIAYTYDVHGAGNSELLPRLFLISNIGTLISMSLLVILTILI